LAAKSDRMPVPQPTSSTTLPLNRKALRRMAFWYVRVRTVSFSISSWMPAPGYRGLGLLIEVRIRVRVMLSVRVEVRVRVRVGRGQGQD